MLVSCCPGTSSSSSYTGFTFGSEATATAAEEEERGGRSLCSSMTLQYAFSARNPPPQLAVTRRRHLAQCCCCDLRLGVQLMCFSGVALAILNLTPTTAFNGSFAYLPDVQLGISVFTFIFSAIGFYGSYNYRTTCVKLYCVFLIAKWTIDIVGVSLSAGRIRGMLETTHCTAVQHAAFDFDRDCVESFRSLYIALSAITLVAQVYNAVCVYSFWRQLEDTYSSLEHGAVELDEGQYVVVANPQYVAPAQAYTRAVLRRKSCELALGESSRRLCIDAVQASAPAPPSSGGAPLEDHIPVSAAHAHDRTLQQMSQELPAAEETPHNAYAAAAGAVVAARLPSAACGGTSASASSPSVMATHSPRLSTDSNTSLRSIRICAGVDMAPRRIEVEGCQGKALPGEPPSSHADVSRPPAHAGSPPRSHADILPHPPPHADPLPRPIIPLPPPHASSSPPLHADVPPRSHAEILPRPPPHASSSPPPHADEEALPPPPAYSEEDT